MALLARLVVALFGAFVLIVLGQTFEGVARTVRGLLSGVAPEPESWALVRVFHAPAFRRRESLTGLAVLLGLLLLRPDLMVKVLLYSWAAVILLAALDYALRRVWRWTSRRP